MFGQVISGISSWFGGLFGSDLQGNFEGPPKPNNLDLDITDSLIIFGFAWLALQAFSEFKSPTRKSRSYSENYKRTNRMGASYGKGKVFYG